jgi:ABC-type antimicrobial peptide transport system permease subunit
LREETRALDPDRPIFNIRTLDTDLANQRWPLVVVGSTFGLFAVIGLVLSAIGLFGLTSYSVATRMKEIALRMALGAMPSRVLVLLFGRVIAQVFLGLALGVGGASALGQVLQGLLVQTSATDTQVLTTAGVVLLVVAAAACLVPARRATRIDPLAVLRSSQL